MQHRKRTKVTAALLALCMLVSLLPVTAFGLDPQSVELGKGSTIDGTGYHVTSVKNYSIAPDISERVIITNNDAGNSQTVANVMEVNTSGGRAKIVAGYGNRNPKEQGWTLKTTTDQAHVYEKESGLNVVGGVNASWFNINTGEPSGYLVMNGVVHHDSSSRAFIAAFDDGSVNVFREGTTLAQAEADQSAKQGKTVKILEAVDALVAMVWDGKVVITESGNSGYYPRTCVGIKADGTDAEKAQAFIAEIYAMNERMGIPKGFDFIQEADIPQIIDWALAEANPNYPVPVVYNAARCRKVIDDIRAKAAENPPAEA